MHRSRQITEEEEEEETLGSIAEWMKEDPSCVHV